MPRALRAVERAAVPGAAAIIEVVPGFILTHET